MKMLALKPEEVFGEIKPPEAVTGLGFGAAGISQLLNRIIELIYLVAGIVFVFMVIISAVQWIMSGGDKEAVGKARSRLIYAIIGMTVLALAFVIIRVIGQITGFEFFRGQNLPRGANVCCPLGWTRETEDCALYNEDGVRQQAQPLVFCPSGQACVQGKCQ